MNDEQQLVVKVPLHGILSEQGITTPTEEELRNRLATETKWAARETWRPVFKTIMWGDLESLEENARLCAAICRTLRTMVRVLVSFICRLEAILEDKATYDRIFRSQLEKQFEAAIELDKLEL